VVYRRPADSGNVQTAMLERVLGISDAQAAATPASRGSSGLPGALGLPQDSQALLDQRYLWDTQGNLLHIQNRGMLTAPHQQTGSYAYDAQDRLIVASAPQSTDRYFYDGAGNRLLAQQGIKDQADLSTNSVKNVYEANSNRLLGGAANHTQYDSGGQPQRIADREYVWDAFGKLSEIRQENRSLASYSYNHRGERVAKVVNGTAAADAAHTTRYLYQNRQLQAELDGQGRITRQYVYLAQQPIAVIDTPDGSLPDAEERSPLAQVAADIGTALKSWFGSDAAITYLHNNHLGAPEVATDQSGKPVWQAGYSAFGKIVNVSQAGKTARRFTLNLRLPGQYEDQESGLYYNDHRYYDADSGRYLTPDPMGLRAGINTYAYVSSNPLKNIDPYGLILFAFDGTGNTDDQTWLTSHDSSLSNVVNFRQLYNDGDRRYVSGVGTIDRSDPARPIDPADFKPWYVPLGAESADMGANYSGPARITRMVEYFNKEADVSVDNQAMDIDIIGFSRGAAEARDFANRIVANTKDGWYSYTDAQGKAQCQKVNFRFMGLWDTVLSTNWSGTPYNLGIPDQFKYVAQAVALNEYRDKTVRQLPGSVGAFPLESILGGTVPTGDTRIERGFIGAHADIGGGFSATQNQLAQVPLAWMVDQAKLAGLNMSLPADTVIANPVLHDKSDNQYLTSGWPAQPIENREVRRQDGTTTTETAMTGTGMTNADTKKYIDFLPATGQDADGNITRIPRKDYVTGTVNMQGYLDWLNANDYKINLKVAP
jgi:RHS repeat-associated protein